MKLKAHSGLKKRVKISGNGKVMFAKACKRHLLSDKTKKAKGRNHYGMLAHPTHMEAIAKMLPGML